MLCPCTWHYIGDIRPFKQTTWSTHLRCVGIWKDLVGMMADIARCFQDHGGVSRCIEKIPVPEDGDFHRKCYNYFTGPDEIPARLLKTCSN